MFNGLAEIAMSTMRLPVFYKQRDLLFFPVWAYSIPTWILKLPVTLWEVLLWVCWTYYAIGLDTNKILEGKPPNLIQMSYCGIFLVFSFMMRNFGHFFMLICVHQMASALYRCVSALGRSMIVVNTFGSCTLLAVLALGGFVLSKDNIHP